MVQLTKKILIMFLLPCLLWSSEKGYASKSYDLASPIDIAVHDGQGSILVSWSIADSIVVYENRVFIKEFGQENFEVISTVPRNTFQYLDLNCNPGTRYFYKVEVIDINGKIYDSGSETPAFGTCKQVNVSDIFDNPIRSVHHLIIEHLDLELKNIYPYQNLRPVLHLLSPDIRSNHKWIEIFPLEELEGIRPAISFINQVINDDELIEDIIAYGEVYRNHLYIDPSNWDIIVDKSIMDVRNEWELLNNQYIDALDFYDMIAPVRIVGCKPIDDGRILEIYLFHPEQIQDDEIYLISGEEFINISGQYDMVSNLISVQIPDTWDYIDLMMGDVFIQNCPLFIDDSIIFTIEGDIIPMDSNSKDMIRVDVRESTLNINELTWSPYTKKVGLELMGRQDIGETYAIYNNKASLWSVYNSLDFDIQYIDSSFTLDGEINLPTTIKLQKLVEDVSTTLEYIVLDTLPFAVSRMPNGGAWHYSDSQTLGLSNEPNKVDDAQEFVPELFVLYQNYPNPFNGQTKISFDLLEDAIVNLYITDATGRIHDKLIDEEYKNTGMYNYLWNGDGRSTGIYFITLVAQVNEAPPAVFSRKMIYLK